jgi:predicted lysophospholipase L1 biosynthesis ABC-type transport system permease subunit
VRVAVHAIDPTLPISEVRTLDEVAADALSQARFATMLLGLFAALAVTLATVGVYGLVSLLVARRRREIGIRIALGAHSTELMALVLRRGLRLSATGVGIGTIAAAVLSRLIASLLYKVTPLDQLTFTMVPGVMALATLLACVVPAVRATRVDPTTTRKSSRWRASRTDSAAAAEVAATSRLKARSCRQSPAKAVAAAAVLPRCRSASLRSHPRRHASFDSAAHAGWSGRWRWDSHLVPF